jgi:serine/threonine protein kinase
MYHDLRRSPNVRVADETIPELVMFAYKQHWDHLLSFGRKDVPLLIIKQLLKAAVTSLATLHDNSIVHLKIEPSNTVVDWQEQNGGTVINNAQITGMEDALYTPHDKVITKKQFGNELWRSPEAHASSEIQSPSDVFSLGIVIRVHFEEKMKIDEIYCRVSNNKKADLPAIVAWRYM